MRGPEGTQRTVLVIHPGAVGDVLLARKALLAVREAYPAHALGLVARGDIGALLCICGEADRHFPLEGGALTGLLAGTGTTPSELGPWLRVCDLALCWMDDPGGLRATLEAAGVSRTVMQSASGGAIGVHQADHLLSMLDGIVHPGTSETPLALPDAVKEEGLAMLAAREIPESRFVMIHPGSGSLHKCVAPGILARVADELSRRGIPVVLAEGPADEAQARDVLDLCAVKPAVIGGQELLQMAGILAHATLFIGHDSGLTHLAAALNVPTVGLFGPTDAGRWAPRGPSVRVLSGPPCQCKDWQAVKSCTDKPCLRIAPESILSACAQFLPEPVSAAGISGHS